MIKDERIEMIEADWREANTDVTNCPVARAVRRHFSNNTGKPAIVAEAAFSCVLAGEHYWDLDDVTMDKIREWDTHQTWALPHTINLMYAFQRNQWYSQP